MKELGIITADGRSFNPTLVRLRPVLITITVAYSPKFQSHAGSIEADPPCGGSVLCRRVSIPRWFD